ncbi:MAG: glutamate-1-semialdehyde 2,1-aminomutase, partial [Gammaproteobacteria bacterium]
MSRSTLLLERARRIFPGGVNSPVRSFKGVGGDAVFISKGRGALLYDEDENSYIDYVGSWGPLIAGHCHPHVQAAIRKQLDLGASFGAPCSIETELGEALLARLPPSINRIRFVNSGTEAGMTAIRLARGITGRDLILKFSGGYHGHSDSLLVKAGSGAQTLGVADSLGVPEQLAALTRVVPYNDVHAVQQLMAREGAQIAAILVEPVAGNMGMIPPVPGFLKKLQQLCQQHDSLLIFDEVMTGFRIDWSGAVGHFGIEPDLLMLGKVVGGGLPVAAVAGKADWMNYLAPQGQVYQAGTLSGNPLGMAAGLATLELATPDAYAQLDQVSQSLVKGFTEAAQDAGIALQAQAIGGMFGICFTEKYPTCLEDIDDHAVDTYRLFFHLMLKNGIYLPPSPYESMFVSLAHNASTTEQTLTAVHNCFKEMK